MPDTVEVALLLRAETVALFERTFGPSWPIRIGCLVDQLAPIIAAAEAPPKRKPRKPH